MANNPNPNDQAPKGVGESVTRRGEDVEKEEGKEAGRQDTGKKGPAERPTGTSTPRDATGVGPSTDPKDRK